MKFFAKLRAFLTDYGGSDSPACTAINLFWSRNQGRWPCATFTPPTTSWFHPRLQFTASPRGNVHVFTDNDLLVIFVENSQFDIQLDDIEVLVFLLESIASSMENGTFRIERHVLTRNPRSIHAGRVRIAG